MGVAEKHAKKNAALAQEHISEPVLAAGVFVPGGTTGAAMVGGLLGGLFAAMKYSKVNRSAPGFRGKTLIAVTADDVHAFRGGGLLKWKVKEPIGSWSRHELRCSVEEKKLVWMVTFEFPDGSNARLEAHRRGANAGNEAVVRMLADPAMARAAA